MVAVAALSNSPLCHLVILSSRGRSNVELVSSQVGCVEYSFVVHNHCTVVGVQDLPSYSKYVP